MDVNLATAFIFFCFLPLSYSFTVASFLHDFRNVRTRYYQQFGIKHNQFEGSRISPNGNIVGLEIDKTIVPRHW